jgi:hypothetical protein
MTGALEHMRDKARAVRHVQPVLRVGDVFICLIPTVATAGTGISRRGSDSTPHLSTDRFLTAREVETLIGGAELALQRFEHWRFIPQGDLPVGWGSVLRALDWVGAHLRVGVLRGGIRLFRRPHGLESSEFVKRSFCSDPDYRTRTIATVLLCGA